MVWDNVDLAGRYFGNPYLYLMDALAGSIAVLMTSMLLENSGYLGNGLAYLGKRTIPIFILHKPIVQLIGTIPFSSGVLSPVVVTGSVIISIAVSLCVYSVFHRLVPAVFGEKGNKQITIE